MAGRIMTARTNDGIHLVDISLLPEFRNRGIGTILIGNLLADAERAGLAVHLQVLQNNSARHLYERLGFSRTGEHDFYFRMQWRPKNGARPVEAGHLRELRDDPLAALDVTPVVVRHLERKKVGKIELLG